VGVGGSEQAGEDFDRGRVTCAFEAGFAMKGHEQVERVVFGSLGTRGESVLLVLR
jgi:hypothetical protein